jgi:hypothetical protein
VSFNLAEIRARLADPLAVASLLGLRGRRQAGGCVVLCPVHDERTPSCSITTSKSGELRVRCFSCGWAGDVFGLVGAVRGLSVRVDFSRVVQEAAELAGVEPDARTTAVRTSTPTDPVVRLAHRIQSAAIDILDDRHREDEEIARAPIDDILSALDLLEQADEAHRAETKLRDDVLDRLAAAYEGEDERRLAAHLADVVPGYIGFLRDSEEPENSRSLTREGAA